MLQLRCGRRCRGELRSESLEVRREQRADAQGPLGAESGGHAGCVGVEGRMRNSKLRLAARCGDGWRRGGHGAAGRPTVT